MLLRLVLLLCRRTLILRLGTLIRWSAALIRLLTILPGSKEFDVLSLYFHRRPGHTIVPRVHPAGHRPCYRYLPSLCKVLFTGVSQSAPNGHPEEIGLILTLRVSLPAIYSHSKVAYVHGSFPTVYLAQLRIAGQVADDK